MKDLLIFLVLCIACVAAVAALCTTPLWIDCLVVILLRRLGLGMMLFPTAVGIAVSITCHPEQWSSDGYHINHPDIGRIWIGNAAYGIRVETAFGKWQPNFIERRIIREAVDWRIGAYIRDRLEVALRKNALIRTSASSDPDSS
jgi:hypothetical protein